MCGKCIYDVCIDHPNDVYDVYDVYIDQGLVYVNVPGDGNVCGK